MISFAQVMTILWNHLYLVLVSSQNKRRNYYPKEKSRKKTSTLKRQLLNRKSLFLNTSRQICFQTIKTNKVKNKWYQLTKIMGILSKQCLKKAHKILESRKNSSNSFENHQWGSQRDRASKQILNKSKLKAWESEALTSPIKWKRFFLIRKVTKVVPNRARGFTRVNHWSEISQYLSRTFHSTTAFKR